MHAVFVPRLLLCAALFYLTAAETSFEGPVRAQVVRVIDGDTFDASARIWLGQAIEIRVRILGIDAPELHARCDAERQHAEAAREYLSRRIEGGEVKLTSVRYDKYGGRIDAAVADAGGDIARAMLKAHMARPYEGGRRVSWCED
jgi:endonuclease YncB( thermonuclease family)